MAPNRTRKDIGLTFELQSDSSPFVCVLIRVASRYHLTFTTKYIHNVQKTFLPLVTTPCRFDQITHGKTKPRTEGFINHVPMAAILMFRAQKPVRSGDLSYNLGQNKWKTQTTPPPKSRMEKSRVFALRAASQGDGGFLFHFILSKIVDKCGHG